MENKKLNNPESLSNTNSLLENVFSLFCGNDPYRPVMLKPFVVGDKTYATDAHALIRCNNDNIDFPIENNEQSLNVDAVIPAINCSEILSVDHIDWASLMNTNETIGDGEEVECGNCYGEGVCGDSLYYKSRFYDFEYDCPVCDGSGYEEEETQILTGEKVFNAKDIIKLKGVYFFANNFYKLKKVKDLIGGDIELISYNENHRGIFFRIGIVEILIMPIIVDSDNDVIVNL